jgi:subtilisin family serine protease
VAGAEWADSLGAHIVTSSLGYRYGFTHGESDYLWTDMDGNTTIATIGADIAGGRGIVVITSAGNEGFIATPENTLIAPTDGDSVLSIGAIDSGGSRVSFSSVGLSADGRIKPDVMAMGSGVRAAHPSATDAYTYIGGTSLACPLVAGAAALLIEANPNLTAAEVLDALRATASQSGAPDRLMGYGIVDAAGAAAMTSVDIARDLAPQNVVLHPAYPNPFNPTTTIAFELRDPVHVNLSVFNVRGQLVKTLVDERRAAGPWSVKWNGADRFGARVSSGVYVYRLIAGDVQRSRKMVLIK